MSPAVRDGQFTAVVRGTIRYPDAPDREGGLGLVGGEDVFAHRGTFRAAGEAMTWCRRILDGTLAPRWEAHGALLHPHTAPVWAEADVSYLAGTDDAQTWHATTSTRTWVEQNTAPGGVDVVVRTDATPQLNANSVAK